MGALKRFLIIVSLFTLVISFQNCGPAFNSVSKKSNGSETTSESETSTNTPPPPPQDNPNNGNGGGGDGGELPNTGPISGGDDESIWEPGVAYPLNVAQIHSGHSLTDSAMFQGQWPGHGIALINALAPGSPANVGKSTVPGSPMWWRRLEEGGNPDAWNEISNWQLLVITERNDAHPEALYPSGWEADARREKREELRIWLDHVWQNGNGGNGTPLVYYTNWPAHEDYAPSANWRQRLADNEVEWMARIAYAESNKTTSAPPIRVIPGNALMMRLYDDAQAGLIPGLGNANEFLSNRNGWWIDGVHAGPYTALALAYLHVAVIHGVDPLDMPHAGLSLPMEPGDALAGYLKNAVRDVIRNTPRTRY